MVKLNPGSFLMISAACLEACKAGSLKTGDIAVFAALAKFADNHSKECWPSVQKICETIGISRPTVISALERLTQAGLIETVTPPNHGKGKATKRRLVFNEPSNPSNSRKQQASHLKPVSEKESTVADKTQGLKYLEGIKKNIRM